ncbi:hypothetical protein ACGF0J_35050 [Nonomuraea sp. NPDC047897]|uniref:hypothetical protein n=1 Tax=Nonomuraea sp. NPDC047897 TaxID=3364346 RepID=UPI00371F4439
MAESTYLNVSAQGVKRVAYDLEPVQERLRMLKETVPEAGLSWHALGVVGMPAAWRYGFVVDGFGGKVGDRITHLDKLAGDLMTTADGYVKTEDANLKTLIGGLTRSHDGYDLHQDPDSRVRDHRPEWGEPGISDDMLSSHNLLDMRSGGLMAGATASAVFAGLYPDSGPYSKRGLALDAAHRKYEYARRWNGDVASAEREYSRAAKLSARSNAVISAATKLSFSALLGFALSLATAIPDDHALDTAIGRWTEMAEDLDEIFGANSVHHRKALAEAWDSEALAPADKKLRDFFTAGYRLADQAVAQANALQDLVKAQNRLHDLALTVSYAELAIMFGLAVAAFVNPLGKVALAMEGAKLSKFMIAVHAAIAAAGMAYLAVITKGDSDDAPPPART